MVSHEEELRVTYERGRIAGAAPGAALAECVVTLGAEVDDLRARVAALTAALHEWGQHMPGCRHLASSPQITYACDCGFWFALPPPPAAEEETPHARP